MKLSAPYWRRICRLSLPPGDEPGPSLRFPMAFNLRNWKHAQTLPRHTSPGRTGARFRRLGAGLVGALLLGLSLPAWASLGGNINSIESDRARMNASVNVMTHHAYDIHEVKAPGSTVVDEYASPDGTVFAVTWHGQFPPPMQQILGSYFQQYSAALQARPRMYGHRPLNIQEPGLVVQTGGHMRAHFGRAYIPSLLPQGLTADQLK